MTFFMLVCVTLGAEVDGPDPTQPTERQRAVLATFRGEFVAVTPGEGRFPAAFEMGSDDGPAEARPAHRVTIRDPFHVARYEVTQELWEAVMGKNPSRWKGPRNSAETLSYHDAVAFCRRATELMRAAALIGPEQRIRLPSEAEWEYVARAGTTTRYSFGDDPDELDRFGWYTGNAAGNDPPVGARQPNAWGLYDVHGYVWEWCADRWHDSYRGAPSDGSAWSDSGDAPRGVLRGGSWKDPAEQLTSGARRRAALGLKDDAVGLRCVLDEPR